MSGTGVSCYNDLSKRGEREMLQSRLWQREVRAPARGAQDKGKGKLVRGCGESPARHGYWLAPKGCKAEGEDGSASTTCSQTTGHSGRILALIATNAERGIFHSCFAACSNMRCRSFSQSGDRKSLTIASLLRQASSISDLIETANSLSPGGESLSTGSDAVLRKCNETSI